MSSSVSLDVRIPIGALFTIDGAILVVYGLTHTSPAAITALAGNVNLWWGAITLAFGAGMLGFGLRARRK